MTNLKQGDKVYWKHNGNFYYGTLLERERVVAEIPIDEDGYLGNKKDIDDWAWNIEGIDGTYIMFEKQLTTDIKSLGN